jgi:hypothetical protein
VLDALGGALGAVYLISGLLSLYLALLALH